MVMFEYSVQLHQTQFWWLDCGEVNWQLRISLSRARVYYEIAFNFKSLSSKSNFSLKRGKHYLLQYNNEAIVSSIICFSWLFYHLQKMCKIFLLISNGDEISKFQPQSSEDWELNKFQSSSFILIFRKKRPNLQHHHFNMGGFQLKV